MEVSEDFGDVLEGGRIEGREAFSSIAGEPAVWRFLGHLCCMGGFHVRRHLRPELDGCFLEGQRSSVENLVQRKVEAPEKRVLAWEPDEW